MKPGKATEQRAGVVRCQRCLKFGHYTFECENAVAYRYRPSATVIYKEKIKMKLNQDKGPTTIIRNPDHKRNFVEDRPSSDDEAPPEPTKQEEKEPEKPQQVEPAVQQ